MRASALVIAVIAVAALWGCKADKCEELPAQAQIDVVLAGIAAEDVATSEMKLIVNDNQEVSRSFAKPTPSFVFKFGERDKAPRTLRITVNVKDENGKVLGVGQLETTFSSDGCNFFTVVVRPGGVIDGGLDGALTDGPVVHDAFDSDSSLAFIRPPQQPDLLDSRQA